eukprot:403341497
MQKDLSKNSFTKDDYLNGNIEYKFLIDTFDNKIKLQKEFNPLIKHSILNSSRLMLDNSMISIENQNNIFRTIDSVKYLGDIREQYNDSILQEDKQEKQQNIASQQVLLLDIEESKDLEVIEIENPKISLNFDNNNKIKQDQNGILTILQIFENRSQKKLDNYPRNTLVQLEILRRMLNPIFSGSVQNFKINFITEEQIVQKGKRMSHIYKQQSQILDQLLIQQQNEDNFQALLQLRYISNMKIQKTLQHGQLLEKAQELVSSVSKKLLQKVGVNDNSKSIQIQNNFVNVFIKQLSFSNGPKPSSREQFSMCQVNNKSYILGGMAHSQYNDLRMLDIYSTGKCEWQCLIQDHQGNSITKRFGHSMVSYKGKELIIFGGGGSFITKIKRRETFNDIYSYDLESGIVSDLTEMQLTLLQSKAVLKSKTNPQNNQSPKQQLIQTTAINKTSTSMKIEPPTKRMGHGCAVIGHAMLIYGGVYGEDNNRILDDIAMFDLISRQWAKIKMLKTCSTVIGPLAYHTMTTVFEYGIPHATFESRLMWAKSPQQILNKDTQNFKNQGVFIFGGYSSQEKLATDKLYLIYPAYEKNRKFISQKTGTFKRLVKPKIYYEVKVMVPNGKGPCPRYLHSACHLSNNNSSFNRQGSMKNIMPSNQDNTTNKQTVGSCGYLAIYGGRNDQLFKLTGNNIALNDLNLYDIATNTWITIALYGESIPPSRWGHQLVSCGENSSKMLLFGGINLQSYCDTSIYEFNLDERAVASYYEEIESKIKSLKDENNINNGGVQASRSNSIRKINK